MDGWTVVSGRNEVNNDQYPPQLFGPVKHSLSTSRTFSASFENRHDFFFYLKGGKWLREGLSFVEDKVCPWMVS